MVPRWIRVAGVFAAILGSARAARANVPAAAGAAAPGGPASAPGTGSTPEPPSPAASGSGTGSATGAVNAPADGEEMVFHASRNVDLDSVAARSMQQVRVGSAKGRYALNFFGDVDAYVGNASSASIPGFPEGGTHPSFALGTLSFLLTGELEKHFVSTAELAFEFDPKNNQVGIDIERLQVGWNSEHFFIYAGRVHTAFGYWSNAYHHGKWLQPTMERPRWVAFEDQGGLLPIHTVGLSGGVVLDAGPGTLRVTASVSNGRGFVVDDIRNTIDVQDGKAVHAQIEYIGLGLPELRVGVSGMYSRIPPAPIAIRPASPDGMDEYILGAHVAYPGVPLLVIAEGYFVAHRVQDELFKTFGGFITLAHSFGIVTPYVRGQWIGTQGGTDPFFAPDPTVPSTPVEELEGLGGLRVDLTSWTALRAEYRATRLGNQDLAHLGIVQWTWGF